jgi:hypothetical protein
VERRLGGEFDGLRRQAANKGLFSGIIDVPISVLYGVPGRLDDEVKRLLYHLTCNDKAVVSWSSRRTLGGSTVNALVFT